MIWALNKRENTMEGDVSWYAETAPMGYEYPDHKYLSRFLIRAKVGANAECRMYIRYDDEDVWRRKGVMRGEGKVTLFLVPIIPRRCGHASIRLEGEGEFQLYGLARELAIGRE
jgi:hypothetical protein